ncbi:YdcF family protein [Puniceicoccales bacterium CK1056]|uniref:YdcF family protein n=1 Tax=Oceanipulchritudo coccoides TaxID=2706888 RepID=A0A6B2M2Q9_9BACT|nr:YdcF family protein [Oceanipulchritudo coccoides]NDV63033.1 YdcF family protein [Oceanipulchritudo coccoides]
MASTDDAQLNQVDWIVVLSGGFAVGSKPGEIVLTTESALRTAHGVFLARKYPEAGVIFTGAGGGARLMQELALARGVDPQRCRIEPTALNTRMHPPGVLALDGVEADDFLLVVSSDWHLPRAKAEFVRYFNHLAFSGSTRTTRPGPLWEKWFPSESAFSASSLYIREWVGRLYYFLAR